MTLVSLLLTSVVIVLAIWLCVALVVLRLAHTATVIGTVSRDDSNSAARS